MDIRILYRCLTLLLVMACTTGCKPTPDTPVIINRDNLEATYSLDNDALPAYNYSAPEKVQDEIKLNTCSFFIDTKVELSNSDMHPVLSIKQRFFSSEDIQGICDILIPDRIAIRDASNATKEEIEEMIAILKQGVPTYNDDGTISYVPIEISADDWQEYFDDLNEADTEDFESISGEMDFSPPFKKCFQKANGDKAYLSAQSNNVSVFLNDYGNIQMQSWIIRDGGWPGEGPVVLNPSLSADLAKQDAEALLERLRLDNMVLTSMETARMLDGISGYSTLSTGWYLTYVRNDGGEIPFDTNSVSECLLQYDDEALYAAPWRQETVCVFVDETGIRFFSWSNPYETIGIENANVQLLPFDEILSQMKKLVHFGYAWADLPGNISENFYITRIVLTNCIVRAKNKTESAFLMPTWVFIYQQDSTMDNSVVPGYIAVNAIDGSRVQLLG
ncbi:MAG TPA: DUF6034 family protein [Clostridia bacterium]|nr:DUF6034 family protein [Clostridia bacterium]